LNIFDIIGPVMIGPSSSHTAGAARLGFIAAKLLGTPVKRAEITLYDSFADTGSGHGTDKAIIGGLLGLSYDDIRLPNSFSLADDAGLLFTFEMSDEPQDHPNTAQMKLWSDKNEIVVKGKSIGGGRIEITQIGGFDVSVKGDRFTLVIFSVDRYGTLSKVTALLSAEQVNIAFMTLSRAGEGEDVVMVIETDQPVSEDVMKTMMTMENINQVISVEAPYDY
jgi:L-serine dehydratase